MKKKKKETKRFTRGKRRLACTFSRSRVTHQARGTCVAGRRSPATSRHAYYTGAAKKVVPQVEIIVTTAAKLTAGHRRQAKVPQGGK